MNKDAIRLALHGNMFITSAEQMVDSIAHYMVRSLFITGHPTVILDETNMDRATRDRWISNDGSWERAYVYFDASPEVCKNRAFDCEIVGKYPHGHAAIMAGVIDRKHAAYQPVDEETEHNIYEWAT